MSVSIEKYAQVAEIIRDFLISKDSLRNLCYADHIRDKKIVFGLVCCSRLVLPSIIPQVIQTVKYRNILILILSLAQIPGCRFHELILYQRLLRDISAQLECSNTSTGPTSHPQSDTATPKTEIPCSSLLNKSVVQYESELFKTKRARLLWSQRQAEKSSAETLEPPSSSSAKSSNSSNSAGEENEDEDTTGISNSWYSALICLSNTSETNLQKCFLRQDNKRPLPADDDDDKSKASTSKQSRQQHEKEQQQQQQGQEQQLLSFPIECLLVLTYELLFGSGQLPEPFPKGKQYHRQNVFERGIIDVLHLFHSLPSSSPSSPSSSPSSPSSSSLHLQYFSISQLAVLASFFETNPSTNLDDLYSQCSAGNISMDPSTLVFPITTTTPSPLIQLPIIVNSVILRPLIVPQLLTKASSMSPIERIQTALSYICENIAEPFDASSAKHGAFDVLLPQALRGKYKRTIPRYVRINTNKWSILDAIQGLYNLGYKQLDSVPRAFRISPLPTFQPDVKRPADLPDYEFLPDDQYNPKTPGQIDAMHTLAYHLTPSIRPSSNQWDLLGLPSIPSSSSSSSSSSESALGGNTKNGTNSKLSKKAGKLAKSIAATITTPSRIDFTSTNVSTIITAISSLNKIITSQQLRQQLLETQFSQSLKQQQQTTSKNNNNNRNTPRNNKNTPNSTPSTLKFWIDAVLPDVLCFMPTDDFILRCDFVTEGKLIVQDRSSCLPPIILAPPPHSIVLDACSAPGNKTSYVSAIMENSGKIYAIELNATRAKLLQNRMTLAGTKNITIVNSSFFDINPQSHGYCDVEYILLDPSCSGSGNTHTPQYLDVLLSTQDMLSLNETHPLSHHSSSSSSSTATTAPPTTNLPNPELSTHVVSLGDLQSRLIAHALQFPSLKAIVYSTCSIYHTENECVVEKMLPLAEAQGFELVPALPLFPGRGHCNIPLCHQTAKSDITATNDDEESQSQVPNPRFKANMHYTVRVSTPQHQSGGFFVALFAKKGLYASTMLNDMLTMTQQRYPDSFD